MSQLNAKSQLEIRRVNKPLKSKNLHSNHPSLIMASKPNLTSTLLNFFKDNIYAQ